MEADASDQIQSNWDTVTESFDSMGLKETLLRGVYAYGFERPSAIQQQAILPVASGRDTIAQAQSGTGKTGTFSIGLLQRLDEKRRTLQVLVLSPTRELVDQSLRVISALSEYMGVATHACVGGRPVAEDCKALRGGAQVVVGTPGRLLDLLERGALSTRDITTVVIDEADQMLDVGFKDQVWDIARAMPETTQFCLFSATMPLEIAQLADTFMRNPARIFVKREEVTLEGIRQFYVNCEKDGFKFPTLCDLYENLDITQAVIFCNSRRDVRLFAFFLDEYLVVTSQCVEFDSTSTAIAQSISHPCMFLSPSSPPHFFLLIRSTTWQSKWWLTTSPSPASTPKCRRPNVTWS